MSENNWHEILKAFCDAESSRYALDKPWVKNGVLYATDGRIAVAVPAITEVDSQIDPKRKSPDVARVIQEAAVLVPSNAWPSVFPDCYACGQSGEVIAYFRTCQSCGGEGTQECDLGHEHNCEDCRGNGRHPCKPTAKNAEREVNSCGCNVELGGDTYDRRYIRRADPVVSE